MLLLLVFAFGRLTWQLGDKGLWWDESLSLQRAEQPWLPLVLGHLPMFDGVAWQMTIDQHPFLYFLLQGILIRGAGTGEFALRFVSVMAGTLLPAAVYQFSRALMSRGALPGSAPLFAALLAAVSPFFLWYGQEARPYALWALLAVVSTSLLLSVVWQPRTRPDAKHWLAYGAALAAFLATHYYAVFLLPLHALAWFVRLFRHRRAAAVAAALGLLGGGVALALAAYYRIIILQGGGANFPTIRLRILIPDLLNAFSMGLSVDINDGWWLALVYAAVALGGVLWLVWRPRRLAAAGGWLAVAIVLMPVAAVLVVNVFTPAYMNARHLSLIGGGYLVLLGAGLAAVWSRLRWAALLLTVLMVAGAGYSTVNYFTQEEYTHDDLAGVGSHLAGRLAEGDLVLLKPPFSWRIFEYYLPLEPFDRAIAHGAHAARLSVPRFVDGWETREAELARITGQYRRIWYVVLGTHPYLDLEERTEAWLGEHLFQVQFLRYFSHSQLSVTQYLPEVPVTWNTPDVNPRHAVTFGHRIHLAGIEWGTTLYDDLALPVTLYWQTLHDTDRRYKYILRLVRVASNSPTPYVAEVVDVAAVTEREPYDGGIPTVYWAPGQTIAEMSELPPGDWAAVRREPHAYRLALEVYDGETLEKLPVTGAGDAVVFQGETAFFSFVQE